MVMGLQMSFAWNLFFFFLDGLFALVRYDDFNYATKRTELNARKKVQLSCDQINPAGLGKYT